MGYAQPFAQAPPSFGSFGAASPYGPSPNDYSPPPQMYQTPMMAGAGAAAAVPPPPPMFGGINPFALPPSFAPGGPLSQYVPAAFAGGGGGGPYGLAAAASSPEASNADDSSTSAALATAGTEMEAEMDGEMEGTDKKKGRKGRKGRKVAARKVSRAAKARRAKRAQRAKQAGKRKARRSARRARRARRARKAARRLPGEMGRFLNRRLPRSLSGNRYNPEPAGKGARGTPGDVYSGSRALPGGGPGAGSVRLSPRAMPNIPAPPMRFRPGPDLTLPNTRGWRGFANPGEMDRVTNWAVRGGVASKGRRVAAGRDRFNPQTPNEYSASVAAGSFSGLIGSNGTPMGPVTDPNPASWTDPNKLHFTNPRAMYDPLPGPTEQVPLPEESLSDRYYNSKKASGGPGPVGLRDLEPVGAQAEAETPFQNPVATPAPTAAPVQSAASEANDAEMKDKLAAAEHQRLMDAAALKKEDDARRATLDFHNL